MLGSITRLGIALLNFSQTLLVLLRKHVDGSDAISVNVSKIRMMMMVDRVLQGNVLQVRLFFPLPVDQQLVGVGKDHAFGQRLTIICSFREAGKKNGIILPIFFLS